MDPENLGEFLQKVRNRILRMRFFLAALLLHVVVFLGLASIVVYKTLRPKAHLSSEGLIATDFTPRPPEQPVAPTRPDRLPGQPGNPSQAKAPDAPQLLRGLATPGPGPSDLQLLPDRGAAGLPRPGSGAAPAEQIAPMRMADLRAVRDFTGDWIANRGAGRLSGPDLIGDFTVHIGKPAQGGDSLAYVRFGEDGKQIAGGSIPNLAEMINRLSKGRMKARLQSRVLPLDSPEIYETKPPFIYLTGRSDFKLTDAEVLNLRKYLLLGGCIWGDNALPGKRSRFDIAFRREMKRVIPDADKPFEPLPAHHPAYSRGMGVFNIGEAPGGLNFHKWPVEAIKLDGIEAVIYTANGYGAMWQITFDDSLQKIDNEVMQRTEKEFWEYRKIFYRNLNEETLMQSYRLGINVVAYLLLRYEDKLRAVPGI